MFKRGLDKSYVKKYSTVFTETPVSQALFNLYLSCIGQGLPVFLVSELLGSKIDVRVSVFRVFSGVKFYTGIISKSYIEKLIKLRAHVAPACTEFLVSKGTELVEVASGWEKPLLVVCQYPTQALHVAYEPLLVFLTKALKYRSKVLEPYLPSKQILDLLFKKIPDAMYPFNLVACSGSEDLEKCVSEALLVAIDEYLATLLYATNMSVSHLYARRTSSALRETPELELKKG